MQRKNKRVCVCVKDKNSKKEYLLFRKPLLSNPLMCNLRWAIHDQQLRTAKHLLKCDGTKNQDYQGNLRTPSKQRKTNQEIIWGFKKYQMFKNALIRIPQNLEINNLWVLYVLMCFFQSCTIFFNKIGWNYCLNGKSSVP